MTKQKEILTDSAPMELSPMLVAGVGAAVFADYDCPSCNGTGSEDEHHWDCDGSCKYCPIEIQCRHCEGTGKLKIQINGEL